MIKWVIIGLVILLGRVMPVSASQKDPTPPDPNRPYFDTTSKYDYQGNLIQTFPPPIEGGK